jgi:hypothetical protein
MGYAPNVRAARASGRPEFPTDVAFGVKLHEYTGAGEYQCWRRKRHQDHPAFRSAPQPEDEEARARADAMREASEENQSPDYRGKSDKADSDTSGSGGRRRGGGGRNTVENEDSDSTSDSGKKSSTKELDSAIGSGDGAASDKGSSSTPKELESAVGSGDEE